MLNVTQELTKLAKKLGYTGETPKTVAEGINAITASVGEGGGEGCDCEPGYEVVETQLFNETVTTEDDHSGNNSGLLNYTASIDYDSITVTLNGTDYECNRLDAFGGHFYGGFGEQGPDFSNYPFFISSMDNENMLYTETADTYAVVVTAGAIQVSPNFTAAVKATGTLFQAIVHDTTWQEVLDAVGDGKLAYFVAWVMDETGIVGAVIDYVVYITKSNLGKVTTYDVFTVGVEADGDVRSTHLQASSADGALDVVS